MMRATYITWPTEHDDHDRVTRVAGTSVAALDDRGRGITFMVPTPGVGLMVRDVLNVYLSERTPHELHQLAAHISTVALQAAYDETPITDEDGEG